MRIYGKHGGKVINAFASYCNISVLYFNNKSEFTKEHKTDVNLLALLQFAKW